MWEFSKLEQVYGQSHQSRAGLLSTADFHPDILPVVIGMLFMLFITEVRTGSIRTVLNQHSPVLGGHSPHGEQLRKSSCTQLPLFNPYSLFRSNLYVVLAWNST